MKILISIDTGDSTKIVLNEAKAFLEGFPAAEVHVFTVIELSILSADTDFTNTAMMDTMEREANDLFNLASGILGNESFIFSKEIGSPVSSIIEKTQELQCELLIMGTHGRTGLDHILMGSVAEKVLRSVTCNTLVIPVKNRLPKDSQ